MGIDPGYDACGVTVLDSKGLKILRCAIVRSKIERMKVKPPTQARAHAVAKDAFEFIAKVRGAKVVAIEGPAYVPGSRSLEQMAYARQALYDMAALYLPDFLFLEISPTSAKLAAAGSGKATKDQVNTMVKRAFGIVGKMEECLSDSTAVALAAIREIKLTRVADGRKDRSGKASDRARA